QTTRVRALGGTSNIWTGRCSRLHPIDFEINAYTPKDAAWPIDYAELEPYYARAEQTLRVRGGELSSFQAPRSGPLPVAPDREIDGLQTYMESLGVTVDYSPTSSSPEVPNQPVRVADDLLPDFARHPLGTLLAGSTVTRLEIDDSGRVTGAVVQDLDRRTRRLRAGSFVIACGAIESARLLLLSTSSGFPSGLGNSTGLVGKYFGEHPNLSFKSRIQQPPASLSREAEMGRCHQYYDSLKREGYGSAILKFAHGRIKDDQALNFRIGATMEMQPVASNQVSLDPSERDYFDQPVANIALSFSTADQSTLDAVRALANGLYASMGATEVQEVEQSWSHHHIGTCRMGVTPQAGVVDRDLLLHGSENLFVLGSAVFVTGGASHPTLTIVALAHRLAELIAHRVSPATAEEAG
ncbi:MAG: GMC family oxidoreductase, partial [Gammaproteobacteria bacterium]